MDQVNSLRTEYKFKKTEIGKIPVDWEVLKFSDVSVVNPSYKIPKGSECAFVEMAAVNADRSEVSYFKRRVSGETGGTKFKEGDTLFARITPCTENGKIAIIKNIPTKYGLGSTEFIVLSPKQDKVDSLFLFYSAKQDRIRNYAIGRMRGTTGRQRVPNEVFSEELYLAIPPIPEQKKIAEILSTADEAIEKKKEVIEKTKELKKGMMQELLTRGIGHKKFKKTELGEIPEEWEVVRVRDVCNRPGYGFTASATDKPIGPKFLRITDIQAGNVNWDAVPYCECPNTLINDYLLKSGDILFARTGATTGKSYIIKNCPKTVFASYLIRITTGERIIPDFLYQVFNSFFYWKQINQQIGGSAQGGVNASLLSHIKVPLPLISEQKRIIDILSSVEDEIDINIHDLVNIDNIKRGLMQELLTGKIRVIG